MPEQKIKITKQSMHVKTCTKKHCIEQYYTPIGNKSFQILIGDAFDYTADNRHW